MKLPPMALYPVEINVAREWYSTFQESRRPLSTAQATHAVKRTTHSKKSDVRMPIPMGVKSPESAYGEEIHAIVTTPGACCNRSGCACQRDYL